MFIAPSRVHGRKSFGVNLCAFVPKVIASPLCPKSLFTPPCVVTQVSELNIHNKNTIYY